jgi:hypothetical protein
MDFSNYGGGGVTNDAESQPDDTAIAASNAAMRAALGPNRPARPGRVTVVFTVVFLSGSQSSPIGPARRAGPIQPTGGDGVA